MRELGATTASMMGGSNPRGLFALGYVRLTRCARCGRTFTESFGIIRACCPNEPSVHRDLSPILKLFMGFCSLGRSEVVGVLPISYQACMARCSGVLQRRGTQIGLQECCHQMRGGTAEGGDETSDFGPCVPELFRSSNEVLRITGNRVAQVIAEGGR